MHATDARDPGSRRAPHGSKKTTCRTTMEENGANKTTTFTPADLHDDQGGDDKRDHCRIIATVKNDQIAELVAIQVPHDHHEGRHMYSAEHRGD